MNNNRNLNSSTINQMNNPLLMNLNQQNFGLEKKLNNEINKNKELQTKIEKLNIIIQNDKNEILKLKSELQTYKNENEILKLNLLKANLLSTQNKQINNNDKLMQGNGALNYQLNLKNNEINNLKSKIQNNKFNKSITLNDIIVINFISTDYSIHEGIKCLADETFAEVEERLYQKFNEFRNTNNTFLFKGNQILRFKKIRENQINDKDIIQLVKLDSSMISK